MAVFTQTRRLILRDFTPADFEAVHEYSSDYENIKHMVFGPNTEEDTRRYLEEQCPAERMENPRMHYNFALELKEEQRVIGGISLHLNWRRDDGILGMVINRRYGGHGYATEAMRGVLDYAFSTLRLHRVHAVCDVDNPQVQRILEKCGMRNEGRMVKRGKARPEAAEPYFDQFGYAILREEWK